MTRATYVALLRGINVGGKNKLPMSVLAELFSAAGCTDVRTYIQSGNVIFSAPQKLALLAAGTVTTQIATRFGYKTPVILRTSEQLGLVHRNNPFRQTDSDDKALHVMFLATTPLQTDIDKLDPLRSPGDAFVVRGQDVYLHVPHNLAGTKLTNAYFDSKLDTTSTSRNWRTITKLLELVDADR